MHPTGSVLNASDPDHSPLGVGEYTFVIVEVTMKMVKVRIRTCLVIRMLRMILITNSNYV